MRLSPKFVTLAALIVAAVLCYFSATAAAGLIERGSHSAVKTALIEGGHDWATVQTDGLQVRLAGTAPSEAARFRALSATGAVVDATRVIDQIEVEPAKPITAPKFSIEILRNDDGISMIGLIPAQVDRDEFAERITGAVGSDVAITDLLETADYPLPEGWDRAVKFGLYALKALPRSKVSIAANRVAVTAISSSGAEKRRLETMLAREAPDGVKLVVDITAPRPVITPFTLRFLIDENGTARFDACSADTEETRRRILSAARSVGLEGQADCVLGLGVPTPDWATAAEQAIAAVGELGGGAVTFSDADISLIALAGTAQNDFDRVVGDLESNLPEVFSLASNLPEKVSVDGTGEADQGPPEFVATRSPEGRVALRGRVTNEQVREAVRSFAQASFGSEAVYLATRLDPDLPDGWPIRVLAGLTALGQLNNGTVVVQPAYIEVRGITGNPDAKAEIARHLAEKLGEGAHFELAVTYQAELDPLADLPTPEQCLAKIVAINQATKITFEPGSTEITGPAVGVMDRIAEVLKGKCSEIDFAFQIGGHTDSQGREQMNQQLSQQRADAVLQALMDRRVLTGRITSIGYGEAIPIADNETEEGREANRRIEFKLVSAAGAEEAGAAGADGAEGENPSDDAVATEAATDGAEEEGEAETPGE
ncbi:OmpA family protein [Oceanicola sp. 502str15]|uniref:OmpA family protein n=1 Tax=Oceanicola sp. 502str15 TaxID=2696061 RepID=UPI002095BBAD|nr:OmpA family protein [Oceanicola sp. 502str15]MCO6384357.1 OmpA family protein [Oceanicola sp. 502str15]